MAEKSILITGCSSGIGLAAAIGLKARGWRVIATARNEEDLVRLQVDIGVEPLYLELSDPSSVAACADKALEMTEGRLFALFNNAAYGQVGAIEDISTDLLRYQMEVNLFSWHELVRRVLPYMRAQKSGRIVQCSSVLGFVSGKFRGSYCASKFALEALSDAMRLELRDTGIHVSLIEPGPIRTRFVERALDGFRKYIDIEGSAHREEYFERLALMEAGGQNRFKLEPEAVVEKLIHALESSNPKARYFVTIPTYAANFMRRVLPVPILDRVLLKLM